MSPLPLLFNIISPSKCSKTRKGKNRYTDWKGRNKIIFVPDDMIVYVENLNV